MCARASIAKLTEFNRKKAFRFFKTFGVPVDEWLFKAHV